MPFYLLLVYTASYFLHLTSRIPELGGIRFDLLIINALMVFFFIRLIYRSDIYHVPTMKAALVFMAYCILSIPLVKWPGSVIHYGFEQFLKGAVFFFFIAAFVNTLPKLKLFFSIFIACQLFRAFEPAYLHFTQGYWGDIATDISGGQMHVLDRLSGAPHDVINPNQLAWVINTTLPFLYYLGIKHAKKSIQILSFGIACGLLYPLLLTGSRSGLVSTLAIVVGIMALGPSKFKRLSLIFLVGLPLTLIAIRLLSPDMAERYLSLVDSSAVGAGTVAGRITGLKQDLTTVMNIHIIFGHGLGTSSEVNVHYLGSRLLAHNLYIEALQEVGIVGFLLFLRYIYLIIMSLRGVESNEDGAVFIKQLIPALKVWIFMDLIYSLSCFGLNSWEWYFFGGVCVVYLNLSKRRASSVKSNSPLPTT
jgi:putative inorganic carbon (HCO3(-)) transporter